MDVGPTRNPAPETFHSDGNKFLPFPYPPVLLPADPEKEKRDAALENAFNTVLDLDKNKDGVSLEEIQEFKNSAEIEKAYIEAQLKTDRRNSGEPITGDYSEEDRKNDTLKERLTEINQQLEEVGLLFEGKKPGTFTLSEAENFLTKNDKNGDSKLSKGELKAALKKLKNAEPPQTPIEEGKEKREVALKNAIATLQGLDEDGKGLYKDGDGVSLMEITEFKVLAELEKADIEAQLKTDRRHSGQPITMEYSEEDRKNDALKERLEEINQQLAELGVLFDSKEPGTFTFAEAKNFISANDKDGDFKLSKEELSAALENKLDPFAELTLSPIYNDEPVYNPKEV